MSQKCRDAEVIAGWEFEVGGWESRREGGSRLDGKKASGKMPLPMREREHEIDFKFEPPQGAHNRGRVEVCLMARYRAQRDGVAGRGDTVAWTTGMLATSMKCGIVKTPRAAARAKPKPRI